MFKIKVNITFRKKTLLFLNWKLDNVSVSGSVCAFKETRNKIVFFKNISWYCQMILHVGLHKVGLFLGHVTSCRNFSNFFLKTIISVISDTGLNMAIYESDVGVFSIYGFKHLKTYRKKKNFTSWISTENKKRS